MGNALLDLGLNKGDRVAILSHNSIENAESYFSLPNAGLVLVMLNFRLAPKELLTILKDSGASVLMVNKAYREHVDQIKDELDFIQKFIFIGPSAEAPGGWLHYETMIEASSFEVPPTELGENDLAALMYTKSGLVNV